MKKAIYRLDGGQSKVLDVIKKNQDGTYDLGLDGKVLVARAKLEKEPEVGSITAGPVEAPATPPPAGGKTPPPSDPATPPAGDAPPAGDGKGGGTPPAK